MSRPASAFPSPSATASSSPSSPLGGVQRTPAQFEPSSVQLATELADFFRLVAPHRLQDVPRLVRAFAAQPEALIASLQAEYREELEAVRNQAVDQDPHLVPASNNKDQYVMRVLSMYQTYAPHKLKPNGNPPIVPADVILARYAGDEPALLAALTVKYGPEPEFSYRWFSDAGTMPPPSPQRTVAPSVADLALRDGPNPIRVQRLVQSMMQNHHGSLAQLMSGLIERFGPEPVATDPVSKYSWEARLERFVKHYWDDIVITSQSTPGSPRSLASGASSPRPGMVADDAADAAMLASLGRGTAPVQHRMEWAAVEDLDLTDPFPGLRIEGAPRPGGHAASPSRRDVLLSHVPVLPLTMTNADLALLPSLRGELGAAPTVYWLSRVLLWDTTMTAAPVWRTVVLTDSALLIATAEDIVDCILPLPGPDNRDSPRQLSMEVTVFMPPQAAPRNSVDPTLTGALPVNAYGGGSDDDVCVVTLQARPSRASRYFEAKKSAHVRAFERHAAPMSTAEVIVRKAQDAGVDALRNITLVFPGMYLGARQATVTNDQHRPPLQRATGRSQGPRFVTVLSRVIARNDPSCTLGKRLHARITPPPAYVAEVHPRLGMRLEHPLLAQHVRGAIAAAKGSDPDL